MEHQNFPSRVVDFYALQDDDFRAIIQSQHGTHVYASQISKRGQWCACVGNRVHKHCNHMNLLVELLVKYGEHREMSYAHFETEIGAINSTLLGGMPKGTLTGFYGEPQCGKSTTSVWVLLDIMRQTNKNGVVIDTETGLAKHFLPDLLERFNEKHNTDIGLRHIKVDYRGWLKKQSAIIPYKDLYDDNKSQQIIVIDATNISELFLLVGRPYELDMDGAVPKLSPKTSAFWRNIWDTPLAQILDDPNSETEYCGFVLDSLTSSMKIFGTANQNFPVRDTAQSIIINQLSDIINYYDDMIGINVLHASRPPQDATVRAIPVGGKSVGHGHKYIVQFSGAEAKGLNTMITITPYRLPTKLGNLAGSTVTINDKGVN